MGREVSSDDVLRTIKMALTRWHRRELYFSDVAYREDAALPSGVSDKYVGLCWNETSVDGALAEKAKHVVSILKDVVGSALLDPSQGFASRRSKDDRPFIETFFRKLGSMGFQRLSNTTGANPKEELGRKPEVIAVKSQFQIEYAEELLDALIANYNATPHTSLGSRSPLAYLDFASTRPGVVLRHADPDAVQAILSIQKLCRVKGGLEAGRSQYVSFYGATYSSDILKQRLDLTGQYIWVSNQFEDDARVAEASTQNGQRLGVLRAAPPWHKLPHSIKLRQAICSLVRRRAFDIAAGADATETFIDFCEEQKGKKLPIHPAYLEARKILIQAAEMQAGTSMVEVARQRDGDEGEGSKVRTQARAAKKTIAVGERRKVLPARRLAKSAR